MTLFFKLDEAFTRRSSTGVARMAPGSSFLSVPPGMDVFARDSTDLTHLHHHNIPEDVRVGFGVFVGIIHTEIEFIFRNFRWNT